ncbi:MAG: hypothetical protein AAF664_09150 [Planctomycetota bacterium]
MDVGERTRRPLSSLPFNGKRMDASLNCLPFLAIPMIGIGSLISAKLATTDSMIKAHGQFYAVLVAVIALTARTVYHCEPAWLLHTLTLGCMVVGALAIPGQKRPQVEWSA